MKYGKLLGVLALCAGTLAGVPLTVQGQEKPQPTPIADVQRTSPVDFEREILPIFKRNCLACHNATKKESDLVLETPQTIAKGGASGPVVVPKEPDKSPLLRSAAYMDDPVMPPADNKVAAKKLTSEELGLLKKWILEGATGTVSGSAMPITWQALPAGVNPIYAVAISPDGQFAACGRANQIFIYHVPTGREVGRLTDPELLKSGLYTNPGVAHLDLVQSLAFSPDGLRLASGSFQEVKLWSQPRNVRLADFASAEGASVLAISPDRKWLAVGGSGNVIRVFELAANREHKALAGHTGAITALKFSADSQKLFSGSADKSIRVWNVADGQSVGRIDTPQPVTALALLNNGTQLASGGGDNLIRLWTTPTGRAAVLANVPQPVTALAASPDRKLVAIGGGDGKIVLVEAGSGNVTRTLSGHGGAVTSLQFNQAGNRLASGSADKTLRIWDPAADQPVLILPAAASEVTAVAVNPNATQAATASGEGDVALWKLDAAGPRKFNGDNGAPATVSAVSPDGKLLAAAGLANGKPAIVLYEIASGNLLRAIEGHEGPVTALGFSGDNAKLVSGSADKTARVWNVADGKELARFGGHAQTVTAVALNANGSSAVSGAADSVLKSWNAADGAELKNFAGHGGAIVAVAFNTDGSQVVSGSADQTVRVWNASDGAQIRSIAHGAAVTSMAVSRDNKLIAAAGGDNTIKLYNLADGALVKTLSGHAAAPVAVGFSPDHARLVSGSPDNQALVWDVASGKLLEIVLVSGLTTVAYGPAANTVLVGSSDKAIHLHTLKREFALAGHTKRVTRLLYAADGASLFSAGQDGLVLGFTPSNGQAKFSANHTAAVNDLALSGDGKLLASAGENREVRLWNAANGQPHAKPQLAGFDQPVKAVVFTTDSQRVAGGSAGGQVLVFNVASGAQEQGFLEHTAAIVGLAAAGEQAAALFSASADKTVQRWSPSFIKEIAGHGGVVTALEAVPNAPTQVLSGSADGTVRVFETSNGQAVKNLNHGAPIVSVAVRADGQQYASAGGNSVKLWSAANNQQVAEMKGDVRVQRLVAALTRGKQAAENILNAAKAALENGKKDATAKAEAAKKAAEALAAAEKTLKEKQEALAKVKMERDGVEKALADAKAKVAAAMEAAAKAKEALDKDAANESLKKAKEDADKALAEAQKAAAEAETKVKATDKPLADAQKAVTDAEGPFTNAKRVNDQAASDVKRANDLIPVLEAAQKAAEGEQARLAGELDAATKAAAAAELPMKYVAFSPDNAELLAGGDDRLVHTYSTANGQAMLVFEQGQPVQAVAYVSERNFASTGADNHVLLWNGLPVWTLERAITGFVDRVLALDFSRDGKLLAAGGGEPSRSGELKIFNVADGALIHDLKDAHSDTVFGVEFSYDGKLLASGAADKFVKVFNVADARLQKSFEGHTHHVLDVSWQYDGKLLASCGADSVVKVWNFETGEQARTIQGFGKQITSLKFVGITPEFVSACGDKNVHHRRASDGGNVRTYGGASDFVYSADVTPDGQLVVAGGQDSVLRVYNGTNAQVLRTFEPPKPAAATGQTAAK